MTANQMTKSDAIDAVKLGWFAYHPQSGGEIDQKVEVVRSYPVSSLRYSLNFSGDCSPKDGWQVVWLGEY